MAVVVVTGTVIAPLVPPSTPSRPSTRAGSSTSCLAPGSGTLPLANGPIARTTCAVYGLSALDHHGRITDLVVLRALGWAPATRLRVRHLGDVLIIEPNAEGTFSVTAQNHLRLPAAARHRHGLATGNRVLLVADQAGGHLLVCPPAVLDDLFADLFAAALGGDHR
ncbi:AbrB/MazE/SpoVT family DNA-binding domain-containing protein [Crossiella sp. CA-258035]|uniref:AbrB/MazE/SpoVT family DNA-binding domain-containing protein n=1 Tax=Crossiella sp. CA-258035 TaxID=2981138 RepID=UPI0024BC4015|nr:AbrB/MazE/SpoVT family DNA-binding domain-containing protein [Crossiella sp. CA-258035]WHT20179.1 AbrB/MazE/SpoVT family DNA-binding domain-containing protein [Crossiella sp. CA-258035]